VLQNALRTLSQDAAHCTGVGVARYISSLAIRFAGIYVPLVTMYHMQESGDSHSFLLRHALIALPLLVDVDWTLISDRDKGLAKAYKEVVKEANAKTQHLADLPHIWRNVMHNYPALKNLGAENALKLVQDCLFATTRTAFATTQAMLNSEYERALTIHKPKGKGKAKAKHSSAVTSSSSADASSPAVALSFDATSLLDAEDQVVAVLHDAAANTSVVQGEDAMPTSMWWYGDGEVPPRLIDGSDYSATTPGAYIESIGLCRFLVSEMTLPDGQCVSSNSSEASHDWMYDSGVRSSTLPRSIYIMSRKTTTFMNRTCNRLQKLQDERQLVCECWPNWERERKGNELDAEISRLRVEQITNYKYEVSFGAMAARQIYIVTLPALECIRKDSSVHPPPTPDRFYPKWQTPTNPGPWWTCSAKCASSPQRTGHLCLHCKAVARFIEKTRLFGDVERATLIQYGYAPYYRVEVLLPAVKQALRLASSFVFDLDDISRGRELLPMVPLAPMVPHFYPPNGGRPSESVKKRRTQNATAASDYSSVKAAVVAASASSDAHQAHRCGRCGESGHNKRSCQKVLDEEGQSVEPSELVASAGVLPTNPVDFQAAQ